MPSRKSPIAVFLLLLTRLAAQSLETTPADVHGDRSTLKPAKASGLFSFVLRRVARTDASGVDLSLAASIK